MTELEQLIALDHLIQNAKKEAEAEKAFWKMIEKNRNNGDKHES